MLRSKSTRSGFADFWERNQTSVISRTLSASRFCRGDALASQIDSKALKPVGRNSLDRKKSSRKTLNLTESQINRILAMQEHMGQIEEELKWAKERLMIVEGERNEAIDEAREIKKEVLSPKKKTRGEELLKEIENLKESLCSAQKELSTRDKEIESLKIQEIEKAKQFETKLAENEVSFNKLKQELNDRTKSSEDELQKVKVSEAKLLDSLAFLTKQLEQTKIELEESKLLISSLQREEEEENGSGKQEVVVMEKKEKEEDDEDEEDKANHMRIIDELRNELRLSLEAEEKSKKAMDDLAMALKEVASEANFAKQKLNSTELELDQIKGETDKLKEMIRGTEEKYEKLLEETRKEAELHRNTSDRLRSEAEESLLAWNGKEMCFVGCIKRAEEEKAHAQYENARLIESLKVAERVAMASREESFKVRDILKQAISEANAAKAAAGIAKDENSNLKDSLAEKEEAIHFLTRENERLRLSEFAAYENLKEFKMLLATASTELKFVKDHGGGGGGGVENLTAEEQLLRQQQQKEDDDDDDSDEDDDSDDDQNSTKREEEEEDQRSNRNNFKFNIDENIDLEDEEEEEEELDPEKAEALKGSIFDTGAISPQSEPKTPKAEQQQQPQPQQHHYHHRRESSSFYTANGETFSQDDLEHMENGHYEDADNNGSNNNNSDRLHNHKRRRALFRRVGDLIMRKSFPRKDPSTPPPPSITSPSISSPSPSPSPSPSRSSVLVDQQHQ